MTDEIKDNNLEQAERMVHKNIGNPPIRCVPSVAKYDITEKTSVFSVYLNIDSSNTASKENSNDLKKNDKEKAKDNQLR